MAEKSTNKTVEAEQARVMLGRHEAVAIDLRGDEAAETGRPPGATVVLNGNVVEAAEKARGDEDLPVLVFSEDGSDSEAAVKELADAGIEAQAVEGGWQEWLSSGQPIQPKPDKEFEGPDLSKVPGAGTQR